MCDVVSDFAKIHAEFRPKVQRYLTQLVGEQDSEDLTQEVFVKISRTLHTFRGESALSTWIYRIATNTALDKLRSASFRLARQNIVSSHPDLHNPETEDEEVGVDEKALSLEQQLFRKERYECYCTFIDNLPPNYRTIVALSELGELAADEIAEALGLSLDVVKIRLHRGRVRLLKELKSHCKPEDWL